MATLRLRPSWQSALALAPLVLALASGVARSDDVRLNTIKPTDLRLPDALTKPVPESVDDLKQIQTHVKTLIEKVMPAVVNIRAAGGQGSGVIVTEDGYILTAGHVSKTPNKDCVITFPSGKEVKGKTLGWNQFMDSGMVKIVKEGKYPFCEMGKSGELKKGEWCLAIGHPGGYKEGRSPPVRVGRIVSPGAVLIQTDCTLVGGDSGGPLFDMYGKVIAIHSRIDMSISKNLHVPVDTYRESWDKLAQGDFWNAKTTPVTARLGLKADAKSVKVIEVENDSPADKAGVKIDDIITQVNGKGVASFDELRAEVEKHKPGETIRLLVRRGEETLSLQAILGKSPVN